MRRLEGWLHQHLFKVGWLVTKDFSTTTILYYLLFLPGVVLHEFTRWLVAGMLNVRAERAIRWPEKQEIGELKLDFVRLAKNTGRFRLALISVAPLLVGMALISFIASSILQIDGVMAVIYGESSDWGAALAGLFATPDLWLWAYLILTISNTMMPEGKNLRGWRPVLIAAVIIIVALYLLGTGDAVLMTLLSGPLANTLNILALTFAVIIGIDVLATGILGGIEALIERVTGDSATFQNGKLVAMRREEVLRLRQQQQEREKKQEARAAKVLPGGPPSIYKLHLPVPPPPGREAAPTATQLPLTPAAAAPAAPTFNPAAPQANPSPPASPTANLPAAPTFNPAAPQVNPLPPASPTANPPAAPTFNPAAPQANPSPPASPTANPPAAPMFTPPPLPKPVLPSAVDEDDEDDDDDLASPVSPPPAAASKPFFLTLDDEDDDEDDAP